MLKKYTLLGLVAIIALMFGTMILTNGCSNERAVNQESPVIEQADALQQTVISEGASEFDSAKELEFVDPGYLDEYPFKECIGISADSVNALGRAAMKADKDSPPMIDGWQLYVSVPFYSQNDPHWAETLLGYNTCCYRINRWGCHLTCVAMLYAKWGYYQMSPLGLNNWSNNGQAHYAFAPGSGNIRLPQAISYGVNRSSYAINSDQIYGHLRAGHPVIIKVYSQNTGNHYMVVFGFDGARYWAKDPIHDWRSQDQPLYGSFVGAWIYGY